MAGRAAIGQARARVRVTDSAAVAARHVTGRGANVRCNAASPQAVAVRNRHAAHSWKL